MKGKKTMRGQFPNWEFKESDCWKFHKMRKWWHGSIRRNDEDYVVELSKRYVYGLLSAPRSPLQSSWTVFMEEVKCYDSSQELISGSLRGDGDVVMEAVKQNGKAFDFVSTKVEDDKWTRLKSFTERRLAVTYRPAIYLRYIQNMEANSFSQMGAVSLTWCLSIEFTPTLAVCSRLNVQFFSPNCRNFAVEWDWNSMNSQNKIWGSFGKSDEFCSRKLWNFSKLPMVAFFLDCVSDDIIS